MLFFFSSRRRHTRCALVTGVQTCALPIFCGHATLASGHVLMGGRTAVRFRTRQAGILSVSRDRDGYALSLPAWPTGPRPLPELAEAMGGDILETQRSESTRLNSSH